MLRYKTETRPGLVALYDIRPGNGAGPFLQPRSPHGARWTWVSRYQNVTIMDFTGAKDDGGGGDNCSYNVCKIPVKSPPLINQDRVCFTGWLPFLLPNQQCRSTEGKSQNTILPRKIYLEML